MAAGKELNPTEYIGHHLTHGTKQFGDGGFWTLNVDSLAVSDPARLRRHRLHLVGGARRDLRRAEQAPGVRRAADRLRRRPGEGHLPHGDRNAFVAPAALTVFVWVLLMNSMDFLPVDIVGARHAPHLRARLSHRADRRRQHDLRARALGVVADDLLLDHRQGLRRLDPRALLRAVRQVAACRPTSCSTSIEYISKPLSHSLRLYGNMYAGEIIFLLLWLLAATGLGWHRLRLRSSAWAGRSSTS